MKTSVYKLDVHIGNLIAAFVLLGIGYFWKYNLDMIILFTLFFGIIIIKKETE